MLDCSKLTRGCHLAVLQTERMLKLVGTEDDMMLVESFRILMPDGGMKELQAVMSLRGTNKREQQSILETFGGGGSSAKAAAMVNAAGQEQDGSGSDASASQAFNSALKGMKQGMKGGISNLSQMAQKAKFPT